MGFDTHKIKQEDGSTKVFQTCNDFWECNCKTAFYHTWKEATCNVCMAYKDDQPDATVEEMLVKLNGKEE